MIRPASPDDAFGIAAIWNPIIRDTTITFNAIEKSPAAVATMITERQVEGRETFVAINDQTLVGFATYGQFRGGIGYQHTAEHTIILSPAARGHGMGRALMSAIEDHARNNDVYSLWAGVSSDNPDGVAFHQALGYHEIATLPQVGFKFGKWLDLVLMQKRL